MSSVSFRTTILQGGKTATGIEVPPELVAALGTSRRPAVRATVAGHTYRSSVAVMGGRFMLPVSAAVREAAGVAGGDAVDVRLELDDAPREVTLPDDFAQALGADERATAAYEQLSYSRRRRLVEPIGEAKTEATRRRRIDKAVEALREGRA